MEKRYIEKTAFITYKELYEFVEMPFGLSNALITFQRTMQMVLGDLFYTVTPVYIDDIIVHSKIFDKHLKILEEIFKKIRNANLKLGSEKCKFCLKEIKFLIHIVGENGIKMDLAKIEKVKNYPRSQNLQLREFLGLAKYYKKFIKDFAKPLNDLTKGFRAKPRKI